MYELEKDVAKDIEGRNKQRLGRRRATSIPGAGLYSIDERETITCVTTAYICMYDIVLCIFIFVYY